MAQTVHIIKGKSLWAIIGASDIAVPFPFKTLTLLLFFTTVCTNTDGTTGKSSTNMLVLYSLQHQYIHGTLPGAPIGEEMLTSSKISRMFCNFCSTIVSSTHVLVHLK
jgi:hypothetical protein